jgi:hypothetical protein
VAACFVAMLISLNAGYQRPVESNPGDCATFFATVMFDVSRSSNAFRQTFPMNRVAVNMEWNVIPGFSFYNTNPSGVIGPVAAQTNRPAR